MFASRRDHRVHEAGGAGFTLVETLVALVIFVAGYVLVQQSVSLSWYGATVAQYDREALRVARALSAVAGTQQRLDEGQQTGRTATGYDWAVNVRRYYPPGDEGTPLRLAAYWVEVTVRWKEGPLRRNQSLLLSTVKLVTTP